MRTIHAILPDGRILTGVEVFRRLYEAVGLGWVYAVTKNESVLKAANAVYDVWAKYRSVLVPGVGGGAAAPNHLICSDIVNHRD